jgi:hypothetical protein
MTQAFNLSQFANNLNSSGATSNAGLQNSAVTVTAGTGMSGGGSATLGSSVTLTNAGVTSVVAGTGISVSGSTGAVTISSTTSGGVTSAIAGNGVAVSGATGAVTFSASCPTFNTVGSYCSAGSQNNLTGLTMTAGSNYAAGNASGEAQAYGSAYSPSNGFYGVSSNSLSGTWKYLGPTATTPSGTGATYIFGIMCRVS